MVHGVTATRILINKTLKNCVPSVCSTITSKTFLLRDWTKEFSEKKLPFLVFFFQIKEYNIVILNLRALLPKDSVSSVQSESELFDSTHSEWVVRNWHDSLYFRLQIDPLQNDEFSKFHFRTCLIKIFKKT